MCPEITDIAVNPVNSKRKPIELVACLQTSKNDQGHYYFLPGPNGNWQNDHIKDAQRITRVGQHVICDGSIMDVIIVSGGGTEFDAVYLGHWNDGVLK